MAAILAHEGRPIPVPPVETAERFLATRDVADSDATRRRRVVIGAPAAVHSGIEQIANAYKA
jgi:hypothetical protein